MENKVRIKIGEIEFEAEGASEVIERERSVFFSEVLPAAVDAIARTKLYNENQIISQSSQEALIVDDTDSKKQLQSTSSFCEDLSKTSLGMYLKEKGDLKEPDFVILAAFFDKIKNENNSFTSEKVKQYYANARRPKPANISDVLQKLAQKAYIMDEPGFEGKKPRRYVLTGDGEKYAEEYKPKHVTEKTKTNKSHKTKAKVISQYSSLCADDINLSNYPDIKHLKEFKEQMILVMYIVTTENKGEVFSVADVIYLLTDVLGLPATVNQVNGVFNHNKTWFKTEPDPTNKKANCKKLLQGGKDFAQSIIAKHQAAAN